MAANEDLTIVKEPLIQQRKSLGNDGRTADEAQSTKENLWMVYLSTFVAVCGSYEFGACVSILHTADVI